MSKDRIDPAWQALDLAGEPNTGSTGRMFNMAQFALPAAAIASMKGKYLSADRRASLVLSHGEKYAVEYEQSFNEGIAESFAENFRIGASDERARWRAILGSPEARGRESGAIAIAARTNLTPEAARALLAAMPEADPYARSFGGGDYSDLKASRGAAAASPWVDVAAKLNAELPPGAAMPAQPGGQR